MAKKDVLTFEVDGKSVEMRKVEPDRFPYGFAKDGSPGALKHRTKHEVRLDGELVGFVHRPNGIGYPYSARNILDDYDPAVGHPVLNTRQDKHEDLSVLATLFVKWNAEDDAPTAARIEILREEYARDQAERKRQDEARQAQWAAERQERDRKAEEYRTETLEALQAIRDRLHGQMSNFEVEALSRAMAKFER